MTYKPVLEDKRRRPRSEEEKAKIRAALLGRKRGPYSPEHCAAISAAKKGKPATPAMWKAIRASSAARKGISCDNGLKGYKQTPEHRAKISASNQGHAVSATVRQRVSQAQKGRKRTEAENEMHRQVMLQRYAREDVKAWRSKLEMRVEWLLGSFGFTPQFRFAFGGHPYDYGNKQTRVLIEVNGCYWHSHGCLKKDRGKEVIERDAVFAELAEKNGYRLIVLWQCEERNWPMILKREGII